MMEKRNFQTYTLGAGAEMISVSLQKQTDQ